MKLILQLSGEHPTLPLAELKAVLEGELLTHQIELRGRTAYVYVEEDDHTFIQRLAYTKAAAEHISEAKSVDGLAADVYDSICDVDTFRVTASANVQKRLGSLLTQLGLEVDLKNPEREVVVFEDSGVYVAGVNIPFDREYQARRAQYRPYFHPTSMHPKLARALVNLTRVRAGDRILDPFCGTGGVLIEAGLMGLDIRGWDIDRKMVEGCRQNLRAYKLSGDIQVVDAVEGKADVDAIATDPPYGRASYASEETGTLYKKFLANARDIVGEGRFIAVMTPAYNRLESDGFSIVESFDVYIHKSLTRRIFVMEAI